MNLISKLLKEETSGGGHFDKRNINEGSVPGDRQNLGAQVLNLCPFEFLIGWAFLQFYYNLVTQF